MGEGIQQLPQDGQRYASSLKACTHLYNDGVRIFLTLGKLGKAIKNNPQGIIASMSMNNLYIETATELVTVFTAAERCRGERRHGKHADRRRTQQDLVGIERQTVGFQPETATCST